MSHEIFMEQVDRILAALDKHIEVKIELVKAQKGTLELLNTLK